MKIKKFRALKDNISNCAFYYGSLIYNEFGEPIIYDVDTNTYHICIKGTEGQFTGLHDKNGKEIYEDDIIEYIQHHFNTEMTLIKRKVVNWKYDRWNIYETNAGESDIKIIGNTHENPELL